MKYDDLRCTVFRKLGAVSYEDCNIGLGELLLPDAGNGILWKTSSESNTGDLGVGSVLSVERFRELVPNCGIKHGWLFFLEGLSWE